MSNSLNSLIEELSQLPGIGPKTAQRLAYHILKTDPEQVKKLITSLINAKKNIKACKICGSFSEDDLCSICSNEKRDKKVICVVQESSDVLAMERINQYRGLYHVLNGVISPLDGIGPDDIRVRELLDRITAGGIDEIIVATNPTIEGETTAHYIANLFKTLGVKVTRLAYGLPVGGNLDYADDITLGKALEGRRDL